MRVVRAIQTVCEGVLQLMPPRPFTFLHCEESMTVSGREDTITWCNEVRRSPAAKRKDAAFQNYAAIRTYHTKRWDTTNDRDLIEAIDEMIRYTSLRSITATMMSRNWFSKVCSNPIHPIPQTSRSSIEGCITRGDWHNRYPGNDVDANLERELVVYSYVLSERKIDRAWWW